MRGREIFPEAAECNEIRKGDAYADSRSIFNISFQVTGKTPWHVAVDFTCFHLSNESDVLFNLLLRNIPQFLQFVIITTDFIEDLLAKFHC